MQETIKKEVIIIGSGIGGMALACMLSKKGYSVKVYEKNKDIGGRARILEENGFRFDMGPSWYMMPEVFEHFFKLVGEDVKDLYDLKKLSPSYRVFKKDDGLVQDFYSDTEKNFEIFENLEKGAGEKLVEFLNSTKEQYTIAYNEFMFKNYNSIFDFINLRVMKMGRKLPLFKNQKDIINSIFKNDLLRKVMQYQTVLLGTAPKDTPGIYSLMNYVDLVEGEWYPEGGIHKIPESLYNIAIKNGVQFFTDSEVEKIIVNDGVAQGIVLKKGDEIIADIVISNADIVHTDQKLLDEKYRTKTMKYWNDTKLAPSAFILYLGIKGDLPELSHHNLFFSKNWDENFSEIFSNPKWPTDPSFYVCNPSKTDKTVAPEGHENLFVLVPVAPGLSHTKEEESKYYDFVLNEISEFAKVKDLKSRIVYSKIFTVKDFEINYNAFKGTALGLAHTLKQTAIFRPNNYNKKVKNMYYVGAGTNPGIGMPICLISAELAYKRIENIKSVHPLDNL